MIFDGCDRFGAVGEGAFVWLPHGGRDRVDGRLPIAIRGAGFDVWSSGLGIILKVKPGTVGYETADHTPNPARRDA